MSVTGNSPSAPEALRAATLSFSRKPVLSSTVISSADNAAQNRSFAHTNSAVEENGSLIAAKQSVARRKLENITDAGGAGGGGGGAVSIDTSMAAATLAASRYGAVSSGRSSTEMGQEQKEEVVVSVGARRRMFQEELAEPAGRGGGGGGGGGGRGLHQISPERSRTNTPDDAVDSSNIEDISSLRLLFEKSSNESRSGPVIHAPKPVRGTENASLTAAILATQLSPSACVSAQSSRKSSPAHGTPNRTSPMRGDLVGKLSSPEAVPKLALPPPSRGSMGSRKSDRPRSTYTADTAKHDALLAATLASNPKPAERLQLPQPPLPPPRRTDPKKAPQVVVWERAYESEEISDANADSDSGSRYGTARTSMSVKAGTSTISFPQLFTPPTDPGPPPSLPRRPSVPQLKPDRKPTPKAAQLSSTSTSPSRQSPPRPTPIPHHLTGDSILAATLAPSRVISPSPRKPPAPPSPRRRRRRSLPPPPKGGLRETMREPRTPPKDPSPQRRKPHLVKHPHKHSEGERRRWRHFVTEAERKRYDGLWAANKGLLIPMTAHPPAPPPPPPPRGRRDFKEQQHEWSSAPTYAEQLSDCVDALVVRDIWRRARVPRDQLAEVWELVDRGGNGRLSRDEFVVGTWLVDQCLKGRKLPARVQDEVWESVRRLGVRKLPGEK